MPSYDTTQFDPPAPLAQVILCNPETGVIRANVPMLLDSGADVTLIPQAAADALGAVIVPGRQYELMGFDGSVSFVPVTRLEIRFCGRIFRGQFLLVDQAWGILGRNVLNVIPLLLDGPRLVWDEYRRGGRSQ
jgi:hypothetical protein